ncbi:M14 family metallopeptidase [Massilia sp. MB5]|uniref:succinylglutamate desuccinylase/aspartoacylase family protein n=1 Tax=unclassified Massilia TaxID=2609279 RepID=UPI00067AE7AE|nr:MULTISPECIES: succinylglutamate desuccinylase/aspartoacylase family protein [unclassified Massilia]AKU23853.1 deacylase [Massilia sp. NR 4-1]UMR31196.1 M14 family metallopeptidase [Massilia sp. MB5]
MQAHTHPISAPHSSASYALHSFHFGTPGQGKKVYIQASLHADEVPAMLVAQFLRRRLIALEAEGKVRGEIILVPAANPIGLAQAVHGAPFGRFELASGINFNRGFKHVADELKQSLAGLLGGDAQENIGLVRAHARQSIARWQPASDAEALKKHLLGMAIDADFVFDLHCDNEATLHVYAGTPLAPAVEPLARLMGAQAVLLSLAAGGEPFDEACSRLWWDLQSHFGPATPIPPSCMAVTVELRGEMDVHYELAERDAEALLCYLTLNGVIDGDAAGVAAALPAPLCAMTPLEGSEPIIVPHAGVLVYHRQLGERLKAGEVVADVIDPVSGHTTPLRCTVDGIFYARTAHRHVLRGWNVGKVAGAQAYRAGDLLSQ